MTTVQSLQAVNQKLEEQLTEMYAVSRGLFFLGALLGVLLGFIIGNMVV